MKKTQLKEIQDKILDTPSYAIRIWWQYPHIGPWTSKEEIKTQIKNHLK